MLFFFFGDFKAIVIMKLHNVACFVSIGIYIVQSEAKLKNCLLNRTILQYRSMGHKLHDNCPIIAAATGDFCCAILCFGRYRMTEALDMMIDRTLVHWGKGISGLQGPV